MGPVKIVIAGGGISGLATAYHLSQYLPESPLPFQITLLEARPSFGGVIRTLRQGDFLAELGPDSFMADKDAVFELCSALNLGHELTGIVPGSRNIYVCENGQFYPFPQGFHLMVPANLMSLAQTSLLSWPGKLRAAMDLLIPARKGETDESIASFVRRRFGGEVLRRIVQPLLGSIYGADLNELSMRALLPRFVEMEKRCGSVIRAMRAGTKKKKEAGNQGASAQMQQYGMFVTLRSGMETLCRKLRDASTHVDFQAGAEVTEIRPGPPWKILLKGGRMVEADLLCAALPAFQAAPLLKGAAENLGQKLKNIGSKSMIVVNLGYERTAVPQLPAGSGFVGSSGDGVEILGGSFSNAKFEGRAAEDKVLMRFFIGRKACDGLLDEDDAKIVESLRRKLALLLDVRAAPLFSDVRRYKNQMPHYKVGHLQTLAEIRQEAAPFETLFLTGNCFTGAGVTECASQAKQTAGKIKEMLNRISRDREAKSGHAVA
ncbi:MAG: protoporphyrinogen oxidase [Omnitrophica bacterium GWA2_52_8]|nr:MAG: protoporphyrinogen oxidase [Omnitrophica bacterium GWA2_52_8]